MIERFDEDGALRILGAEKAELTCDEQSSLSQSPALRTISSFRGMVQIFHNRTEWSTR